MKSKQTHLCDFIITHTCIFQHDCFMLCSFQTYAESHFTFAKLNFTCAKLNTIFTKLSL